MAESKEYKRIKKLYGEKFAKLCRELFPQILEKEGILTKILEENFAKNSRTLGEDIIESDIRFNVVETFKEMIFGEYDKIRESKNREEEGEEERTPYEILDNVGYDLYECQTEEDIQSFKKYYAPGEVLCTISCGGRLNRRYCFWAIKKDVDEIKREYFVDPKKSDEYSLSVLAIQFDKRTGETQIISRYNHTVPNPNCTLGNNLDNLAIGLEQSFLNLLEERGLGLNLPKNQKMELPGYTIANDGKYYKYNYEIYGIYYCPGNIVIDGGEARIISRPERGMLIDYFYIDLENKTINVCDGINDSFTQDLQDIEKIKIVKSKNDDKEEKIIKIFKPNVEEPIIIGIDKDNRIVRYENTNLRQVGDNFLFHSESLTSLELPKLEQVGDRFLYFNTDLCNIELPSLEQTGNNFLNYNMNITSLEMPELKKVGDDFFSCNEYITSLKLPRLEQAGDGFLCLNKNIINLELPKLEQVGSNFLCYNEDLAYLELPCLEQTEDFFLASNAILNSLELPNLRQVGDYFLSHNENLTSLELPRLEQAGDNFLSFNKILTNLKLPKLEQIGKYFFSYNTEMYILVLHKLKKNRENIVVEQTKESTTRSEINKVTNKLIETELEEER